MLQEADNTSYHQSHTICSPLPRGMCHFLLEWANSATDSSSVFDHPFTTALSCLVEKRRKEKKGMERKGKEKHTCLLKDQRDLIRSHSWGCYGDGQFRPSGCRSHWCCGKHWVAELWPHRCRESTRGPPHLRKRLACAAHSPCSRKAFLMDSPAFPHSDGTLLGPPHSSAFSGALVESFPSCSNGPSKEQFEVVNNCLWGFWVQLIQRGAQFPLCCVPRGHSFLLHPQSCKLLTVSHQDWLSPVWRETIEYFRQTCFNV